MAKIDDMIYGIDAGGTRQYVRKVRAEVITTTANEMQKIDNIESVFTAEWEGKARIDFLANVKYMTKKLADSLDALDNGFTNTIKGLVTSWDDHDQNMIQKMD